MYSLYRNHILAPCPLCSADSDHYLTCVIYTNQKMSSQCESSFSKMPKKLGIGDLCRLRNPLEFRKNKEYTLWMNDKIANAYLDLLVIIYPQNQSLGNNFYFSTFFTQELMNLSKMTTTDYLVDGSVYNYGAVKNWMERKLLQT
jgi:Ulp1 family protease